MPIKFLKTLLENITKEDISKILSEISTTPKEVKFDIEEFQEIFSEKVNKIILDKEAKTGEEYISGIFNLTYIDEKYYQCSFELYFEDKDGKINSSSAESDKQDISKLTETAIAELKAEKIIKFEIPNPTEEERKKYAYGRK